MAAHFTRAEHELDVFEESQNSPEKIAPPCGVDLTIVVREQADVEPVKASRRSSEDERVLWTSPENTSVMGHSFKAITKRAGLSDLRFHDLRHEATARLFERTSLRQLEIALIAGHSNPATLKR